MNRFLLLLLIFANPVFLSAQSLHQQSAADQQTRYPSTNPRLETHLGYLLQHQFYYWGETETGREIGFSLPTARLRLRSLWDQQYEIFVQVDFVRSISILDAQIAVPVVDGVELRAGLFKSPFSREFLLFPEDLPFTERSRVVRALASNRQVGALLHLNFLEESVTFEGGVFNGNGATLDANNNNRFLVTGRLNWHFPFQVGGIEVGVNGAYSEDQNIHIPFVGISNGERVLVGADAELILESLLVRGEFIAASFGEVASTDAAYGYVGTVGYKLLEMHQVYVSYDVFDPGRYLGEEVVFGYKVYLGEAVQIQANYRLPLDDPKGSEAVLRLQFAAR